MFFDPLVSWIVPVFGFLFDKVDSVATTISKSNKSAPPIKSHPEPHRDPKTGKIIVENCELWRKDLYKYGGHQVSIWEKEGKYNLSEEELKEQNQKFEKEMEHLYKFLK